MNDLTEFKFNNTILSVTMINDEPWFIAKDVCEHLDMKNPSESCSSLDEDEKLLSVIMIAGQRREVLHVNESGLYALVVRSRKPSAKDFRKWVTKEVIPSIRKTGSYTIRPKSALELAKEQVRLLEIIEQQEESVKIVQSIQSSEQTELISRVAGILEIPEQELRTKLRKDGFLMRGRSIKEHNRAFARHIKNGLFTEDPYTDDNGRTTFTTYVTQKGIVELTKRYGTAFSRSDTLDGLLEY